MNRIEKIIEILFYLLILLYFVGKVFKPISFLIDILFIYQIFNNKQLILIFYEKYKRLILSFSVFIAYLLFQSFFLELKFFTFKSSFETIMYIFLVFAALYNFNCIDKIKKLIFVSYIILCLLAIDSFYQYFTGFDFFGREMWYGRRLTAWAERPDVSLMMGQFFGLLISSIFIFKGKEQKIAISVFLISLIVFIIAGNRSPLLALFSTFIFITLFSSYKKYMLILIGLFILIFSFMFLNPKLYIAYSSLLNPTTSKSTSGRYELFDVGIEMIKDNPILGIGSHNYKHKFSEYFSKTNFEQYKDKYYVNVYSKTGASHVHSVFLDMIISYGIFGFFIFLWLVYNIYNMFIKNNEIGLLSSIGFLYCITPLQFGRSFTMGDWQFITYLGLIFLVLISQYKSLKLEGKINDKRI